jgi:hypothetical protein
MGLHPQNNLRRKGCRGGITGYKGRRGRKPREPITEQGGKDMINIDYRKLIAAVIKQAVKDNAAWFLESDLCKGYCAAIGINHA